MTDTIQMTPREEHYAKLEANIIPDGRYFEGETHKNVNKPLAEFKEGEYFGYYEQKVDKDGNLLWLADGTPAPDRNKWRVGQPRPNKLTESEFALLTGGATTGLQDAGIFFKEFGIFIKDVIILRVFKKEYWK